MSPTPTPSSRPAIRLAEPGDDAALAALIGSVMREHGLEGREAGAGDGALDAVSSSFARPRAAYWVLDLEGRIVGGAGYAPLTGGPATTCELRMMYLAPEVRGRGFGAALLDHILDAARRDGYARVYLETRASMDRARALYASRGFRRLRAPEGAGRHRECDQWYARVLDAAPAETP